MNISVNAGRFVFLGFGLFAAIIMIIAGANSGNAGHSISGLGIAMFGVVSYLNPSPLLRPFGKGFLKIDKPDPSISVLRGIGFVLLVVGQVLRWAI